MKVTIDNSLYEESKCKVFPKQVNIFSELDNIYFLEKLSKRKKISHYKCFAYLTAIHTFIVYWFRVTNDYLNDSIVLGSHCIE